VTSRQRVGLIALSTGALLSLAACGGGTTGSSSSSSQGGTASATKGGTLYYLTKRPAEHLDPQRTYIGRDLTDMNRMWSRGLVQFPVTADEKKAVTPIPDLATDTGKSSNSAKTWAFTLKDGVKWEDGKEVTCADLKYGLSRAFAVDVLTGGPNYQLAYMKSVADAGYKGPYKTTPAGVAAFDKAVTCSGKTITYNFDRAWADFPLAIASLRFFDPYRADKDQGDKSNYSIFSDGPYKIQGVWTKGTGGTFVRNTPYDAKTDGNRAALPDKIVFVEGLTNEIISQRLIADSGNDKSAVTDRVIPPAFYNQIVGAVAQRSVNVNSPYANYLVPNFNTMTNVKVRQALALSTNKTAYSAALGGDKSSVPSKSVVNPANPGYVPNPAFTAPDAGDPAAAKAMLQSAGVTIPYPIKVTYQGGTPTTDNAFAALKDTWDKAGFKVTLVSLPDTYYDVVQDVNYKGGDVLWGGWGADWPGISTVIPPLFDSRVNINAKTNGQDYGNFKDDKANQMIDAAAAKATLAEQNAAYADLDKYLGETVAYIPLDITRFYFLYGSNVSNYLVDPASNMYPDLGAIGVKTS
jgi:peptide/nickel transport system substrate-binding protein